MRVGEIVQQLVWADGRRRNFTPKLSVLMPTYRRGADGLFLRAARSILGQTLRDLELIIIDDASTDGTATFIEQLRNSDRRVVSARHFHNIGLPAISEYEAFSQARGEYIAFAFDDFLFEPDALGLLLEHMQYAGAKAAHGQISIRDEKEVDHVLGNCAGVHERLSLYNFIGNSSLIVHRSIIETSGLYDPHIGLSRVCDWDFLRRIHNKYPILSAPVAIGKELGLSGKDSLGNTYPMDFEVMQEMMAQDRSEDLLPGNFLSRDVWSVPSDASYSLERHILNAQRFFSSKTWAPKASSENDARGEEQGRQPDRRPVISIFGDLNASNTLYWKCQNSDVMRYLHFIEPVGFSRHENSQLIRSDAVIFVREFLSARPASALELCREVKIPHYLFLDDNLSVLAGEMAEFKPYHCDNLRIELSTFAGVLVSSRELQSFFLSNELHGVVELVSPVFEESLFVRCRRERLGPAPLSESSFCVAFYGGDFRFKSLQENVVPAIKSLGSDVVLMMRGSPAKTTDIGCFAVEMEFNPYLWGFFEEWVEYRPQVVVHPRGQTPNINYKSANALLIACYLGAVPVLCDERAYEGIGENEGVIKVAGSVSGWTAALQRVMEPTFRALMLERLELFCRRTFKATSTEAVLAKLFGDLRPLDSHGAAERFKQGMIAMEKRLLGSRD
jgi:glycosyltransferase involved in cell wall biosynthesis